MTGKETSGVMWSATHDLCLESAGDSRKGSDEIFMRRHCLTLDLKDDSTAIAEYRRYHEKIWPEVKQSLLTTGVREMEIYLLGRRLFMIMDVEDGFSFAAKAAADQANAKVQEWEMLMGQFQAELPEERKGQRWRWTPMERVFSLAEQ